LKALATCGFAKYLNGCLEIKNNHLVVRATSYLSASRNHTSILTPVLKAGVELKLTVRPADS